MTETEKTIDTLLNEAYDELATHKKAYFDYFAEKGISFELWLTTELAMLLTNKGCEVDFTPRAVSQKIVKSMDGGNRPGRVETSLHFLDLVISYGNETAAVEIKIAHPWTQESYKVDCHNDINKLEYINKISDEDRTHLRKYFLLVVVSLSDENAYQSGWKSWLEYVFYGNPKNRAEGFIPDTEKFISHKVYSNDIADADGKAKSTLVFYQVDINEYFKEKTGQ